MAASRAGMAAAPCGTEPGGVTREATLAAAMQEAMRRLSRS